MAVKVPNPPTPPTPPAVPGVVLSEGGSVTQSNAPHANGTTSKSTDNEKQMEEQAKEAVVNGSGGLSRTTHKDPAAEAKAAKVAAKEARQAGADQAKAVAETGRSQAAQAANLNGGTTGVQPEGRTASGQEETAVVLQSEPVPKNFDYHGMTYWLPMLVVVAVIGLLLVKKLLHRQGRKGELTKADLNEAMGVDESREVRGLTPDEVLARLEEKEKNMARPARLQAETKPPALKTEAGPHKKAKKVMKPRIEAKEEEHKHFEVRI